MPLKIEELVGQLAGRFMQGVRPNDPVTRVYANIVRLFGEHALTRWSAISAAGMRCGQHVQIHPITGQPGPCHALAAGPCLACGRTVCMMHAHANPQDGSLICNECVLEARRQRGTAPPPQPGPPNNDYQERLRYLGVLELGPEATMDEIRRAYRKLARDHHPDGKKGRAKERAEVRMRELNVAYHWLMNKEAPYAAA